MRTSSRRGIILVIILGFLLLIALLAVSFASLQIVERKITANYADEVRARLAAQSGVDYATERLSQIVRKGWFEGGYKFDITWRYMGDVTDDANYYATASSSSAATRALLTTPVERAKNPSFANENDNANPDIQDPYGGSTAARQLKIEGQDRGFSGYSGGTYGVRGDLYALKVSDCQSQINVNEGVQYGLNHSSTMNLVRILNLLGAQVGVANLGNRIIYDQATGQVTRPPQGYKNKQEILRALGYNFNEFNAVRDFLTTVSWRNPKVHNPVPLDPSVDVRSVYPVEYERPRDGANNKIYRHGHGWNRFGPPSNGPLWGSGAARGAIGTNTSGGVWPMRFYDPALNTGWPTSSNPWHAAIWSLDALNPQWIELVERAPVNVNVAAKEVLSALIIDLQGFFTVSRRTPFPKDIFYGFLPHRYYYDHSYSLAYSFILAGENQINYGAENSKQSEWGHIVKTFPFGGTGSPTNSGTGMGTNWFNSDLVANEILACRERRPSPAISGLNYATEPFGGPFRSWAQFNRFVDTLVQRGLLVDGRGSETFFDYRAYVEVRDLVRRASQGPQAGQTYKIGQYWATGWSQGAAFHFPLSQAQKRIANQAMGDVLKANFNPNVHLNELNPDYNMFQTVDKTDLIVASTEFCFVPMGYFEIESVGYVLLPSNGVGNDVLTAPNNTVVATKKISTVVKAYDAEYHSLQADFYPGDFGPRGGAPATNNNRAIESGPEPDNGAQPAECRWDGYLALPTLGAHWDDTNISFQKPKQELRTAAHSSVNPYTGAVTSPSGSSKMGEMIRAHFTLDHVASYHVGGNADCIPIGPRDTAGSGGGFQSATVTFIVTPYTATPAEAKQTALNTAPSYIPGYSVYEVVSTSMETYTEYPLYSKSTNAYVGYIGLTYSVSESAFTSWTDLQQLANNWITGYVAQVYPAYYWNGTYRTGTPQWRYRITVMGKNPIAVREPGLNFPDVPETIGGPYSPPMSTMTATTHRFRLARTFGSTTIPANSETAPSPTPPTGFRYAPSDLRIDGAHVDPHAAFGYNLKNTRFSTYSIIAFWYKPNYYPELVTRIRTLISLVDYKQLYTQQGFGFGALSYPLPFNLFLLPSYQSPEEPFMPMYGEPGRAAGLIYGMGADRITLNSSLGGGLGYLTPTMNHEFEPWYGSTGDDWNRFTGQADGKTNHLRHHEWHHMVLATAPGTGFQPKDMDQPWTGGGVDPPRFRVYINGREIAGGNQMTIHVEDGPNDYSVIHGDSIRIGGEYSMSGVKDAYGVVRPGDSYEAAPRIYYGDGTFDEFYMWRDNDYRTQATDLFKLYGRYYKVDDNDPGDGLFTSAAITFTSAGRQLPPGSSVSSPPSSGTGTIPAAPPPPDRRRRLIAVAWTAMAEDYQSETEPDGTPRLKPTTLDYQPTITFGNPSKTSPDAINDRNGYNYRTVAQVSILVSGSTSKTYGPYHNEGWSPIKEGHDVGVVATTQGLPVTLQPGETVKYRVKLRVGPIGPGSILLMTPYFDDITLFYDNNAIEYLFYAEVQPQP